jgi:carboxymethylenebutenolidase
MTEPTRTETVEVDGGSFDLHVWVPASGRGPGVLLLQEIFGVGAYIRAVAERLAELGYVVGAPDVFWRLRPNWAADHDEAGLNASMELVSRFDFPTGVADCVAALERLRSLDEVEGGVGALGFCLGGTLAWFVAAAGNPDVAVSYYGSGVPDGVGEVDRIRCPLQLHFGDADPFIPNEQVDAVRSAVADRDQMELHVHAGAGHAFDNHEADMFHDPAAASAAWALTTDFLAKHLR